MGALLLETAEDGARDVVTTIAARALSARDQEEGGGVLDDDTPDVRRVGDADIAAPLAQLEAK
jgi:hypothetical protein